MRVVWAMLRASWLTQSSYKIGLLFNLLSLIGGLVPMFFIARALQPVMANSISTEGDNYFSFLLVGVVVLWYVMAAINGLPNSLRGTLSGGTLDSYLSTPTSPVTIFVGLGAYDYAQITVRALLSLGLGSLLGAHIMWGRVLYGFAVILLIVLSYLPFALISSAMIVAFRTDGPIRSGLVLVTTLLGGLYYPTKVIPSWIQRVSDFVPLTYGLRALRRVMLEGASLPAVASDLAMLVAFTVGLGAIGLVALRQAFRYARRVGSLAF